MVGVEGIEPSTFSLSVKCSTTELHTHISNQFFKRFSALKPLDYQFPMISFFLRQIFFLIDNFPGNASPRRSRMAKIVLVDSPNEIIRMTDIVPIRGLAFQDVDSKLHNRTSDLPAIGGVLYH